ncbi:MAG TPA: luciferase family protein [Gaiellaceae bacterium]
MSITTSLPDELTARRGPRPATTPTNPHSQLDQNAPVDLQDRLRDHALSLPGVRGGRSNVSVPGAVAFFLDDPPRPAVVPDPFRGEFGHIHPHHDGSLHLSVPTADAKRLIELGWAEFHHVVEQGLVPPIVIMLYGPRDDDELAVAEHVVEIAYLAAGGATQTADGRAIGLLSSARPPRS